jgi:pilus assembly protein Flp/PilA
VKVQNLLTQEEGQDLVEYAMLVALIAFGAAAGESAIAKGLKGAFSNVSTNLGTYTG